VTSFDIITGMEICLAQGPSSFASVETLRQKRWFQFSHCELFIHM